jgi:transcriptional regulator with XRE-family HTH domain
VQSESLTADAVLWNRADMAKGSIVVRRSLGRRLKALRLAAGKTAADVDRAGVASKAKLARIETGASSVKLSDVRTLCWLYGADEVTTEQLAELTLNNAEQGWWEQYGDVMPSWFGSYVELESEADSLVNFSPQIVPGLLQTPAYQRAMVAADPAMKPETGERQVRLRTERQRAAFERTPPLPVTVIVGADVLAREVGGAAVLAEQRECLVECARESHIEVFVLPWTSGAHTAIRGAFTILGFRAADHPDVAYLETYAGSLYIEKINLVQGYYDMFEALRGQSVTIEEYLP